MIFLLLLLSSLHHRGGIMTKHYYFSFPVSARGMGDKDWPCLRQNILFAFQSKIVVIQENNQRHLCYGKWFIERGTSDVMWNVPTPPWWFRVTLFMPSKLKQLQVVKKHNHNSISDTMCPPRLVVYTTL